MKAMMKMMRILMEDLVYLLLLGWKKVILRKMKKTAMLMKLLY